MVIVQQAHPRTLGFKNHALCGSACRVMPVRKSGARGYILKDDGAGFYEAAGGDRTVLAGRVRQPASLANRDRATTSRPQAIRVKTPGCSANSATPCPV